uniref:nicotinamidase n=1 Tax=Panagrellus redivivus TaxID=6233 RepID=A0A7E4VTK0_PANRE
MTVSKGAVFPTRNDLFVGKISKRQDSLEVLSCSFFALAIIRSAQSSLFKGAIQLVQSLASATGGADDKMPVDKLVPCPTRQITKRPVFDPFTPGMNYQSFAEQLRTVVSDIDRVPQYEIRRLFETFDVDNDGKLNKTECEAFNRVVINEVNKLNCAIIVVDFQNDFVNGSLAIKKGPAMQDPHEALVPLNKLLRECSFDLVVYTQDWHPPNHISFYEHCRNGDRAMLPMDKGRKLKPFDTVNFGQPKCHQILYPAHCLQNSWGAELSPHLARVPDAKYVRKGLNVFVDAYSAFSDNNGENKSELARLLRSEGIDALFICGLAYEICVAATTREANNLGFYAALVADCSKGLNAEKIDEANVELSQRNVAIIESQAVESFTTERKVPWRWVCQLAGISGTELTVPRGVNGVENLEGDSTTPSIEVNDGIKV